MWRHCTLVVAVWLCYLAVDISALVVDCSSNATAISGAPKTPIIEISAVETNILVTSCWIGTHYAAPLYIDFGVACSNVVLTVVNVTGLGSIHCEPFAADNLSITVYNSTAQVLINARSGWATIVFMSIAAVVPISNIAMTLVNVSGTVEKAPTATSAVAQIFTNGAARNCSMRMIDCQFWGNLRPNYQYGETAILKLSANSVDDVIMEAKDSTVTMVMHTATPIGNQTIVTAVVRAQVLNVVAQRLYLQGVSVLCENVSFTNLLPYPYNMTIYYSGEANLIRLETEPSYLQSISNIDVVVRNSFVNVTAQTGNSLVYLEGSTQGGNVSVLLEDVIFSGHLYGAASAANTGTRRRFRLIDFSTCYFTNVGIIVRRVTASSAICWGNGNTSATSELVPSVRSEVVSISVYQNTSILIEDVSFFATPIPGWLYSSASLYLVTTQTTTLVMLRNDTAPSNLVFTGITVVARNCTVSITNTIEFDIKGTVLIFAILSIASLFVTDASISNMSIHISNSSFVSSLPSTAALAAGPSTLIYYPFPSMVTLFNNNYTFQIVVPGLAIPLNEFHDLSIVLEDVNYTLIQGTDYTKKSLPAALGVDALAAVATNMTVQMKRCAVRAQTSDGGGALFVFSNTTLHAPSLFIVEDCTLLMSSFAAFQPPLLSSTGVTFQLTRSTITYHTPLVALSTTKVMIPMSLDPTFTDAAKIQYASWNLTHNVMIGFDAIYSPPWTFWGAGSGKVTMGCNRWGADASLLRPLPDTVIRAPRHCIDYHRSAYGETVCTGSSYTTTMTVSVVPTTCTIRGTTAPIELPLYTSVTNGGVVALITSPGVLLHWNAAVPWPWTMNASWGTITSFTQSTTSNVTNSVLVLDLGTVTNLFSDYTSVIQFALPRGCAGDTSASVVVVFRGSTPPIPADVRTTAQAVTVSIGAVAAIAAGSAGSAIAMQRAMLALQLSLCEFSDQEEKTPADSPTQLGFGPDDGAYIRGAVIGNMLLWLAFLIAILALAVVRTYRRGEEVSLANVHAQARLAGLPGVMVVALSLLLQPTVGSGVALLGGQFVASDIAIGLLGVLLPCGCVAWLDMRTMRNFGCVAQRVHDRRRSNKARSRGKANHADGDEHASRSSDNEGEGAGGGGCSRNLAAAAERFFEARVEWVPRRGVKLYFAESYSAVYEEYTVDRHWFFSVESGVAVACGIISGIRPKSQDGCDVLQWVNLGVSVAAAASVFAWPFRSAHGNFNYALANGVAVVTAALVVAGADTVSDWVSVAFTLMTVLTTLSGVVAAVLQLYRRWWKALSASERQAMTVMKAAAVFMKRWFQVGRGRVSVALKSHLLLSLSRTHSHQPTPEHMANLRLFLENPKKSRLSRMKQEDVLAAVVFEICARAASTRHRSQQRHQTP